MYEVVARNKLNIVRSLGKWLATGDIGPCEAVCVAKAYELVFSDDTLTAGIVGGETEVVSKLGRVEEMYDRSGAWTEHDFQLVVDWLIENGDPTSFGRCIMGVDLCGLAVRVLFHLERRKEAGKYNEKGLALAQRCCDVYSCKKFWENSVIICAAVGCANLDELGRKIVACETIIARAREVH